MHSKCNTLCSKCFVSETHFAEIVGTVLAKQCVGKALGWETVYWIWTRLGRDSSRHSFTYFRGWMQMVLAPNDLFSWNNNTMNYNAYDGYLHYCWSMHDDTYSVHDRSLKPWLGRLPCFRHFVMSSHLPCPGSTDAHCLPLGARAPRPQSGVPSPRVRAHSLFRVQNRDFVGN